MPSVGLRSSVPKGGMCIWFDAWPETHKELRHFITKNQVNNLFVTSKQTAKRLQGLGMVCQVHYVPEGIRLSKFHPLPIHEKHIDVLHLGRPYEEFHQKIVKGLADRGISYLYEHKAGTLIFPDENRFEHGIAQAKVSICVPASITHPQKTSGISTMTQRYLQSMASKCIPVGICPPEMRSLFGYNPVVAIDETDPVGQLASLTNAPEQCADLVERNYNRIEECTRGHIVGRK